MQVSVSFCASRSVRKTYMLNLPYCTLCPCPLRISRFSLQQAALVLNASRRFRYTLDLKKEEEQEKRRRLIRSHAQVIRVIFLTSRNFLLWYFSESGKF